MSEPDLVGLFVAPLERLGLRYMITGGVASVIYGDPRFTRDVDVVVDLPVPDIARFERAFPAPDFYSPPGETLVAEVARSEGGHFKVIHRDTSLRADVYLAGDDSFHEWALDRSVTLDLGGSTARVAPIEYVIVRKLEYFVASGSDRHLRDVAMMLGVSGERIDSTALADWSKRQGAAAALKLAQDYDID